MPRKARLIAPGCIYHVMARSIDGLSLFLDNADRRQFLSLLAEYLGRNACKCYAWALMDNHYHLVLRPGDTGLCPIMKPLNMRYAQYHGLRQQRRGYLFFDRYKSIASQDQGYIERLLRYVHLNPIRAGTCRDLQALDGYLWTGHSAIMGRCRRPFQDTVAVLRRFGTVEAAAREAYRSFIAEGLEGDDGSEFIRCVRRSNDARQTGREPACWVIGDPEFVKKALKADKMRRLRLTRFKEEGWTLEGLCALVAGRFEMPPEALKRRSRAGAASEARRAFAYLAHRELGATVAQIAAFLRVSPSAVSAMHRAGEETVRERGIAV